MTKVSIVNTNVLKRFIKECFKSENDERDKNIKKLWVYLTKIQEENECLKSRVNYLEELTST